MIDRNIDDIDEDHSFLNLAEKQIRKYENDFEIPIREMYNK